MIQSSEQRDPVEVLCEEFLERWRKGEAPSIEDYAAAHPILREQIVQVFPAMLAMERLKQDRSHGSGSRPIQLHVERLRQLGDYRIIREIGRGGMAIVYEAEQQSLHRRVAVKVFPDQAFEDSKHLKRFEREARTVAGLHHNNIVPVFGTGEQDGLHYFVMQLLNGISLDRVIAELRKYAATQSGRFEPLLQMLSRRQGRGRENGSTSVETRSGDTVLARSADPSDLAGANPSFPSPTASEPKPSSDELAATCGLPVGPVKRDLAYWQRVADLGRQVAEGLHYAHSAGVLHRDIKPSNLVIDADWRVWITDFGLATGHTQDRLSHTGDIVGTLRYMAPERLHGLGDARSDIYSLGLTLYELVTLQPALNGRSRGELTRQLIDGTPLAPRQLCRDVPPDLETILLKAIAREPACRYQTAAEFAEDLKNFSEDRPIQARRVSRLERLHRWSRRNPLLASLSAALLLSITVSLGAITVQWRKAVQENTRARIENARAEGNLALALQSMDRFLEKFEADWMEHPLAPDIEDTRTSPQLRFGVSDRSAAVLQEALLFYEEFAKQNETNPKLQLDTAKAYQRAGGIYERLGLYSQAEHAYRSSLETLELIAPKSQAGSLPIAIAEAHNRLAMVLNARYEHHAAYYELVKAKNLLASKLAADEDCEQTRYTLALTNTHLGTVWWWLRDHRQSAQKHRSAVVLLEQLVDEQPTHAAYRLALARAYRNYYHLAAFQKDREYSKEIRQAAEGLLEDLVADYPAVPDYRCELSEMLAMTQRTADPASRLDHVNKAVQLAESLFLEFPNIPRYRAALAKALSEKAGLVEQKSLREAENLHDRAVNLYAQLCEQYPSVADYLVFSATALKEQANCLRRMDQVDHARRAYASAIANQREYLERRPSSIFGKKWLADYLKLLADLEQDCGNAEEASELLQQAATAWPAGPANAG